MTKIYLISPDKIDNSFFSKLDDILSTKLIPIFQLRLKNYSDQDLIAISKKTKDICHKYKVKFILNDRFDLAVRVGADGAHLGSSDANLEDIMLQKPNNFIIGVSCYDSKDLINQAIEHKVDYISLGAFFPTKTKKTNARPGLDLVKYCRKNTNTPLVAIGGINAKNSRKLVANKIDYIAVISYIWDNKDKEIEGINKINLALN